MCCTRTLSICTNNVEHMLPAPFTLHSIRNTYIPTWCSLNNLHLRSCVKVSSGFWITECGIAFSFLFAVACLFTYLIWLNKWLYFVSDNKMLSVQKKEKNTYKKTHVLYRNNYLICQGCYAPTHSQRKAFCYNIAVSGKSHIILFHRIAMKHSKSFNPHQQIVPK